LIVLQKLTGIKRSAGIYDNNPRDDDGDDHLEYGARMLNFLKPKMRLSNLIWLCWLNILIFPCLNGSHGESKGFICARECIKNIMARRIAVTQTSNCFTQR
jgi:hypothetical protein